MSLSSTMNVGQGQYLNTQNYTSSYLSVTKSDNLQTTLEKLRHRSLLAQSRKQQSLKQFEDAEKRQRHVSRALDEAQYRNDKLNKKIYYFRENLAYYINDSLADYQEKLKALYVELKENKEKYYTLEDEKQKYYNANSFAINDKQSTIYYFYAYKLSITRTFGQKYQYIKQAGDEITYLTAQLNKLKELNQSKYAYLKKLILSAARSSDEDYSNYLVYISEASYIAAKDPQILNLSKTGLAIDTSGITPLGLSKLALNQSATVHLHNNQKVNELLNYLVNKFYYQNEWVSEHYSIQRDSYIYVEPCPKNLRTFTEIFKNDATSSYMFGQQAQTSRLYPFTQSYNGSPHYEQTDVQLKDRAKSAENLADSNFKCQQKSTKSVTSNGSRVVMIDYVADELVTSQSRQYRQLRAQYRRYEYYKQQRYMENLSRKRVKLNQHLYAQKVHPFYPSDRQKPLKTQIKTKNRMQIMLGLEQKIKDAEEQKCGLERRLEAVYQSYAFTRDKVYKVKELSEKICSKGVEIYLLNDRMTKLKAIK